MQDIATSDTLRYTSNLGETRIKNRYLALIVVFAAFLLSLCGCGGSGSKPNVPILVNGATFTVVWPARTRDPISAPASALSGMVTFLAADTQGHDVNVAVNRDPLQPNGYTGTYTVPVPINVAASTNMRATFYAQANAGPPVVASAAGQFVACNNGTNVSIFNVVLVGTIKTVTALSAKLFVGGPSTQMLFSALDSSNSIVAVSPGSAVWAITSGSAFTTLTPDGVASAVAAGTAFATATVDGVTSSPASITVSPAHIAGATINVIWPQRSRDLQHNLSSALSVSMVLKAAALNGSDVTLNVDRDPAQPAGYTGTYTFPGTISAGTTQFSATFYSLAGESGVVVGTATASVTFSGVNVNLGSVNIAGVIDSVQVDTFTLTGHPQNTFYVNDPTTQLTFTAYSGASIVPVTPGSALWAVNSKTNSLGITLDGLATPQAAGFASVSAKVDGITSAAMQIHVAKKPRIAFSLAPNSSSTYSDLYMVDLDGSNLTKISNNASTSVDFAYPSFNPSGTPIAFSAQPSGSPVDTPIDTIDVSAGNAQATLLENGANNFSPSYSFSGTQIVYSSNASGLYDIWTMNANGTNTVKLTSATSTATSGEGFGHPHWSPDGTQIVFEDVASFFGIALIITHNVVVMDSAGTTFTALTNNGVSGNPSFSPDGTKVVFTQNDANGQPQVATMNADGSGVSVLTNGFSNDAPAFTPDGLQIVFVSNRDGYSQLYIMSSNGSNQTRIVNATINASGVVITDPNVGTYP